MYSTDGTAEILESYRSRDFRILKAANSEPPELWLRKNEEAVKALDADWLILLDADEFLLPATGSLRDSLKNENADLLTVRRYNVPLGPDGPMLPKDLRPENYGQVQLIVQDVPQFRQHLASNPLVPWILAVPVPKVFVRPQRIGTLTDGMHDIIPSEGISLRRTVSDDLLIAHQPLTSQRRFARKVENIRECFAHHDAYFGIDKGWHWRRWLGLAESGGLTQEFERSVFSPELIQELYMRGVIRTAKDIFNSRQ